MPRATPREPTFIPIEKATLAKMHCERGLTLKEIGLELGMSLRTVHRRRIEARISRRNLGSRPAHGDQPERPAEVRLPSSGSGPSRPSAKWPGYLHQVGPVAMTCARSV